MLGTLKDRQKRLRRRASISIGAPMGNLEGGSSTGEFEIWLKVALELKCFSVWELCERNLEGGLPCCGP